jgi:hypothetical protein
MGSWKKTRSQIDEQRSKCVYFLLLWIYKNDIQRLICRCVKAGAAPPCVQPKVPAVITMIPIQRLAVLGHCTRPSFTCSFAQARLPTEAKGKAARVPMQNISLGNNDPKCDSCFKHGMAAS